MLDKLYRWEGELSSAFGVNGANDAKSAKKFLNQASLVRGRIGYYNCTNQKTIATFTQPWENTMKTMHRHMFYIIFACAAVCLPAQLICAEPALKITTDRTDHLYNVGDTVVFKVNFEPSKGKTLSYVLSEDGETVISEGTLDPRSKNVTVSGHLPRPGFLKLRVTMIESADTVRAVGAAGISPRLIQPTNVMPDDFERFWNQARTDLERIPLDPVIEYRDDPENPESDLYHISLANIDGTRVIGWLRVPKGEGPFPAVLIVPGAGVGSLDSRPIYAAAGFVSVMIEVHGIGIDRPEEYFQKMKYGIFKEYYHFGKEDPYHFYYRRVILGGLRTLDYLVSRPDVDTTRVGVAGSSQGGALTLLITGLDKRVKAMTANVPAMCDHTGALYGRPSGWPRLLKDGDREKVIKTSGYYDAALNAGLIDVPALVSVGFIDGTCAPTSVYAAFNNLKGYKEIDNFPDMAHAYAPGWKEKAVQWLLDALNGKFD